MGSQDDNEERQKYKIKSSDVIYISDREEGEIVDASDLEDVSDISSEEEFLLRQRIKILENFNDVLERKEVKRLSFSNENSEIKEIISVSLSDLSSNEGESKKEKKPPVKSEIKVSPIKKVQKKKKPPKTPPRNKTYHRGRGRRKILHKANPTNISNKLIKRKHGKGHIGSESSAESDRENREKRRKLREAVRISSHHKNDNTSLKLRLLTMLHKDTNFQENAESNDGNDNVINESADVNNLKLSQKLIEGEIESVTDVNLPDTNIIEIKSNTSDDDEDALRQLALQTKFKQTNDPLPKTQAESSQDTQEEKNMEDVSNNTLEEIDSDTAELRLIALKTAILKKAIERKKRQKKNARLKSSQPSFVSSQQSVNSELDILEEGLQPSPATRNSLNNGTDIESVDMDIDDNPSNDECSKFDNIQDADTKCIDHFDEHSKVNDTFDDISFGKNDHKLYFYNVYSDLETPYKEFIAENIQTIESKETHKNDDIDEDEDILRAKLLTSLSNSIKLANSKKDANNTGSVQAESPSHPPISNFVINLGESDSGTDCESTRNLKLMHKKLTEQAEFQKNLDLFLKDARKAAEAETPAKDQQRIGNAVTQKFTPMAVKHLPREDQQEYRKLVKRMAELEKVKQVRHSLLKNSNSNPIQTLSVKQNNFQEHKSNSLLNNNPNMKFIAKGDKTNVLDMYLSESRERLALASENILKLRQEIMQQTNNVQNAVKQLKIAKKELQLKRHALTLAENTLRSKQLVYRSLLRRSYKRNNFSYQRFHNHSTQKTKTKTVIPESTKDNDIAMLNQNRKVQLVVSNANSDELSSINNKDKVNTNRIGTLNQNRKVQLVVPKANSDELSSISNKDKVNTNPIGTIPDKEISVEQRSSECVENMSRLSENSKIDDSSKSALLDNECDYQSPLQYKNINSSWVVADPNAVLCPFFVAGECKDSDCIYLHPKL